MFRGYVTVRRNKASIVSTLFADGVAVSGSIPICGACAGDCVNDSKRLPGNWSEIATSG